ncbi:hypothetical protein [Streptomyces sp. uw30]|uniref:hypothetical protein n=1 Tax=Streptomyces sp. uw30 TaxID=1828179 RepID=UPI0016514FBD|nr:hypothetical protein [Streptomyces sp. uw30]
MAFAERMIRWARAAVGSRTAGQRMRDPQRCWPLTVTLFVDPALQAHDVADAGQVEHLDAEGELGVLHHLGDGAGGEVVSAAGVLETMIRRRRARRHTATQSHKSKQDGHAGDSTHD